MKENRIILKELRKKQFNEFIKNKEFLINLVASTTGLEKDYVEKNLKLNTSHVQEPNDLVTKITESRIKIKTSKFNKKVKNLKTEANFYIMWYDEKNQEYKIKIYLDEIFENGYKRIQKEEIKKIRELFKDEPLTEDDIIDIMIAELGIKYCDNIKVTISGTL